MMRFFFGTQIERTFKACKIDNSFDMISLSPVVELATKILKVKPSSQKTNVNINVNINGDNNRHININLNQTHKKQEKKGEKLSKREQLIDFILKKLREEKEVLKIKMLIVCHQIIKSIFDQEFMDIMIDEMDRQIIQNSDSEGKEEKRTFKTQEFAKTTGKGSGKKESQHKNFIKENIISFYCKYIKKLILNYETYQFAKEFNSNISIVMKKYDNTQTVNHGFVILNHMNFILQSQSTFNKMGRYYIQHEEILKLYLMFLYDLNVYNAFIKEFVKVTLKKKKQISQDNMKHFFLFISQAQKTSDRLYQFYHCRYYFFRIKKLGVVPTFLSLNIEEFKQFVKLMKKNDRQLVNLVKTSKYGEGHKDYNKNKTMCIQDQEKEDIMNRTQIYGKNRENLENVVSFFQDEDIEKSFKDLEETYEINTKIYKIKEKKIEE